MVQASHGLLAAGVIVKLIYFFLHSVMIRLYHRTSRLGGSNVPCPLIQTALHKLIASPDEGVSTRQQLYLDLPAECNDFDWDSEATPNKDDLSPILFRPGQLESPVVVEFDHMRASIGKQ